MTGNETLEKLELLGIIALIGSEYFITEKYKDIEAGIKLTPVSELPKTDRTSLLDADTIMNTETTEDEWSVDIKQTAGRTRAEHFMNECGIPDIGGIAPRTYRLRGLPKECIGIIDNIVKSTDVSPKSMTDAIKMYYKYTEMPKAFKNLLLDGEVLSLYHEYISGTLSKNIKPKDNNSQKWN